MFDALDAAGMVNWVPSIHSGITPNLSHASSKGGRGSSSSVTMADIHMLKTLTWGRPCIAVAWLQQYSACTMFFHESALAIAGTRTSLRVNKTDTESF
jgi:hypothetical protein